MKKLLTLLACSTICYTSMALAVITATPKPSQTYLFVQTAKEGTLSKMPCQPGVYKLTLTQTSDRIGYFSDRPVRIAGSVTTTEFMKKWETIFKTSAPNVGITGFEKTSTSLKGFSTVLELSNPVYDANKNMMTYTARTLSGDTAIPDMVKLDGLSLFIDDFCASCVGQGF